ncbi:MAG: dephospho-CoA kinase [Bacteroidales bacterium]|nr:dephospho-CoA kinase [Bacteroidales bacterium]
MSRTIALTGGIGSGKSTVASLLRERGIPVYDSDSRTKALYDSNPALVDAICDALGEDLHLEGGGMDKSALAAIIFHDDEARRRVEEIVYPAVMADFAAWRDALGDVPAVVIESAVILAKRIFDGAYDAVLYVDAPVETRIARASGRDKASSEAIRDRILAQTETQSALSNLKVPYSVVCNDSSLSSLGEKVDRALEELL